MKEQLRKVEVTSERFHFTPNDPTPKRTYQGLFHRWGDKEIPSDEEGKTFTIGIVELEDGKVIEPYPYEIKFLDKP